MRHGSRCCRRNASENPAGIETLSRSFQSLQSHGVATHQKTQQGLKPRGNDTGNRIATGRNASENPAGIETLWIRRTSATAADVATHQKTQQGLKHL